MEAVSQASGLLCCKVICSEFTDGGEGFIVAAKSFGGVRRRLARIMKYRFRTLLLLRELPGCKL
ncbi:hypothetical protein P4E94_16130 [Pontiellaceae bacterium B12219]|nr:hypothetical protein [Pontiellaceae bacterium B12219]